MFEQKDPKHRLRVFFIGWINWLRRNRRRLFRHRSQRRPACRGHPLRPHQADDTEWQQSITDGANGKVERDADVDRGKDRYRAGEDAPDAVERPIPGRFGGICGFHQFHAGGEEKPHHQPHRQDDQDRAQGFQHHLLLLFTNALAEIGASIY